jgi:hypothetical protein
MTCPVRIQPPAFSSYTCRVLRTALTARTPPAPGPVPEPGAKVQRLQRAFAEVAPTLFATGKIGGDSLQCRLVTIIDRDMQGKEDGVARLHIVKSGSARMNGR